MAMLIHYIVASSMVMSYMKELPAKIFDRHSRNLAIPPRAQDSAGITTFHPSKPKCRFCKYPVYDNTAGHYLLLYLTFLF